MKIKKSECGGAMRRKMLLFAMSGALCAFAVISANAFASANAALGAEAESLRGQLRVLSLRVAALEIETERRFAESEEMWGRLAAEPAFPAYAERYSDVGMDLDEFRSLAALVRLEAGNQPFEGKQGAAEVVLNRVVSEDFPSTVREVVNAPGQFPTASRLSGVEPTEECFDAVDAALYGPSVLPSEVVYFGTVPENDKVWGMIGDHVFCYGYGFEEAK